MDKLKRIRVSWFDPNDTLDANGNPFISQIEHFGQHQLDKAKQFKKELEDKGMKDVDISYVWLGNNGRFYQKKIEECDKEMDKNMKLKESPKYKDLVKINDTTWKYKDKVVIGYNEYGKYYFVSEPEELNWMYSSESLKDLLTSIDNELKDKVDESMKLKENNDIQLHQKYKNDFGTIAEIDSFAQGGYTNIKFTKKDGSIDYSTMKTKDVKRLLSFNKYKLIGNTNESLEDNYEDEVYQDDIILDEDIKETEYNVVIDNIEWAANNVDLPNSIQHDFFLSPYDNLEDEIYKFLLEYSNGVAPLGYSIDYENNESLKEDFDDKDYWLSEENPLDDRYEYIDSKQVLDSDGFVTEYTMYFDTLDNKYVFVFGDSDLYKPEDEDFDWECETRDEAEAWFNAYNGFEDDLDECNLKETQGQNLYLKLRNEIKNSNNVKYLKNLDKKLNDEYLKSLNVDEKQALHHYIVLQIRKINDKLLKEARDYESEYNITPADKKKIIQWWKDLDNYYKNTGSKSYVSGIDEIDKTDDIDGWLDTMWDALLDLVDEKKDSNEALELLRRGKALFNKYSRYSYFNYGVKESKQLNEKDYYADKTIGRYKIYPSKRTVKLKQRDGRNYGSIGSRPYVEFEDITLTWEDIDGMDINHSDIFEWFKAFKDGRVDKALDNKLNNSQNNKSLKEDNINKKASLKMDAYDLRDIFGRHYDKGLKDKYNLDVKDFTYFGDVEVIGKKEDIKRFIKEEKISASDIPYSGIKDEDIKEIDECNLKEDYFDDKEFITLPEDEQAQFEQSMNDNGWVLDDETTKYGSKNFYNSWFGDKFPEAKDIHYQFITKDKYTEDQFDELMDNLYDFLDECEKEYNTKIRFNAGLIDDGSEYSGRVTVGIDVEAPELIIKGNDKIRNSALSGQKVRLKNGKPVDDASKKVIKDIEDHGFDVSQMGVKKENLDEYYANDNDEDEQQIQRIVGDIWSKGYSNISRSNIYELVNLLWDNISGSGYNSKAYDFAKNIQDIAEDMIVDNLMDDWLDTLDDKYLPQDWQKLFESVNKIS